MIVMRALRHHRCGIRISPVVLEDQLINFSDVTMLKIIILEIIQPIVILRRRVVGDIFSRIWPREFK
jgi:hypothetical protein